MPANSRWDLIQGLKVNIKISVSGESDAAYLVHSYRRFRGICYFCLSHLYYIFWCCGAATQRGSWPPRSWGFLDHKQRRYTVGRTPLEEWSALRRDFYLTTQDTHNRQISMPPVGFEPKISAGERQTKTKNVNRFEFNIYKMTIMDWRLLSFKFHFFCLLWRCDPTRVMASSFLRFSRSQTTTHHSR